MINFNFKYSYLKLPNYLYTIQQAECSPEPKLILFNTDLAQKLNISNSKKLSKLDIDILAGNETFDQSFAQAYAGHQFGYFTILGDGRALVLGEHETKNGELYDVQFKGSGRTPYSRQGDGKATIQTMLREYIISESLASFNIPTTRSLAVVETGKHVYREKEEPGAILTRIAKSYTRVGTFEYLVRHNNNHHLQCYVDYVIDRLYPHLKEQENTALALLEAVVYKQAKLVCNWLRIGFIHGVMNTDNMLISGESIDYGPCAFLDNYHPDTVYSSIDTYGRYAFANQPQIAQWNLAQFASTLLPLIHSNKNKAIELATKTIESFSAIFDKMWLDMMKKKIGLLKTDKNDPSLIDNLLKIMTNNNLDYTNTFLFLMKEDIPDQKTYQNQEFQYWVKQWELRKEKEITHNSEQRKLMGDNNPLIIPRNHIVEKLLEDYINTKDVSAIQEFIMVMKNPTKYTNNLKFYQTPPKPSEEIKSTYCGT